MQPMSTSCAASTSNFFARLESSKLRKGTGCPHRVAARPPPPLVPSVSVASLTASTQSCDHLPLDFGDDGQGSLASRSPAAQAPRRPPWSGMVASRPRNHEHLRRAELARQAVRARASAAIRRSMRWLRTGWTVRASTCSACKRHVCMQTPSTIGSACSLSSARYDAATTLLSEAHCFSRRSRPERSGGDSNSSARPTYSSVSGVRRTYHAKGAHGRLRGSDPGQIDPSSAAGEVPGRAYGRSPPICAGIS